jgi:H+-transporting ATPase
MGSSLMKEAPAQRQASAPQPEPKDELKAPPLPELEKRLGSSANGLTQADGAKWLTQYGPNEIEEKKGNPPLKFLMRSSAGGQPG